MLVVRTVSQISQEPLHQQLWLRPPNLPTPSFGRVEMAMSKITFFPIEAWEKGWEKQLPKHFRSFWKKPTASSEIVRRLCFRTHSSLSERSKSICEWMATAWCPKKHSDRPTCDRNKYSRMTNMCSSPYVSHVFPKSMKTNYSNSIYFTNGLGMACHTPHYFFHMTTPLTSEHHPCLMDIFATVLSGSGVALITPKRHPKVGYQWGTNGAPMGYQWDQVGYFGTCWSPWHR